MVNAEFFDIFGIIAFLYVTIISLMMLKKKNKLPKWTILFMLIVGILGLIVDTTIVIKTYLLN